jgi:hypothetical protein
LIDKNVFKIRADVKYQLLIFSSIYGALQLFFKTKYEKRERMEGEEKMKEGGEGRNKGKGKNEKWEVKGNEK